MREDMQHIETRGIDKRTCVCLTSLPPLPSHTLIPLRTTSISWTRRRRHSTRPAPYMSKADICETSKGTKEIIEMLRKSLLLVNTFHFGGRVYRPSAILRNAISAACLIRPVESVDAAS